MARLHGRKSRLYLDIAGTGALPSPVAFVNKWELSSQTDTVEVTTLDDTNKVYISGLPDAQGTLSGFYDDATVQTYTLSQSGVAAGFYLYPSTAAPTKYWYGTAIFDFKVTGGEAEALAFSGSFKAASALTKIG